MTNSFIHFVCIEKLCLRLYGWFYNFDIKITLEKKENILAWLTCSLWRSHEISSSKNWVLCDNYKPWKHHQTAVHKITNGKDSSLTKPRHIASSQFNDIVKSILFFFCVFGYSCAFGENTIIFLKKWLSKQYSIMTDYVLRTKRWKNYEERERER